MVIRMAQISDDDDDDDDDVENDDDSDSSTSFSLEFALWYKGYYEVGRSEAFGCVSFPTHISRRVP